MKQKHFLITLFNLQLWDMDKTNSATLTETWLTQRFQLFETYCLPSVNSQSTKNFTWLCLFDENTPERYKNKVEEYKLLVPQLTPCYFNQAETANWKNHVKEIITSLLKDEDYVITTNIDNDDAIHYRMLETLQQEFERRKQTGLYTFVNGLQYFPHIGGGLIAMNYPHNHFLTYIEDAHSDFKTTIYIRHAEARKRMTNVIDIKDKPYWIEIVHSNNVSNDLRITSRIKYKMIWGDINLEEYGLNILLPSRKNMTTNLLRLPLYFLKTANLKLLRKIGLRK